jgi:hypothetical protein
MPLLGFQRLTPELNVPQEHSDHAGFALKKDIIGDKAMATDQTLETMCFLC